MRISLKELHELVWSMPMTSVAKKLGISDVAVRKICVKHHITRPSQGYWLRTRRKGSVPKLSDELARTVIVIKPPLPGVKAAASKVHDFPQSVSDLIVRGVSTRLSIDSRVCMQALSKGHPDRYGFLRSRQDVRRLVLVTKNSLRRAYLLCDWLYELAPLMGFNIGTQKRSSGNAAFAFTVDSVSIDVTIKEKVLRQQIPANQRINKYDSVWKYMPTGELVVIFEGTQGVVQSIGDKRSCPVERQLDKVAQKLIRCREVSAAKQIYFRERQRKYEIERRQAMRSKLFDDLLERRRQNFLEMKNEIVANRNMLDFLKSLDEYRASGSVVGLDSCLNWAKVEFSKPELSVMESYLRQDLRIVEQLEQLKRVPAEDDCYPWPA